MKTSILITKPKEVSKKVNLAFQKSTLVPCFCDFGVEVSIASLLQLPIAS